MSPRPVESSHSLVVPRPSRAVRAFVADFAHAPLWDPATLRSDPVADGLAGPGAAWITRSVLAGRASTGHYRLEWSTSYGVVLVGRHPGLARTVELALVDLGDHTEVHLTMRYQPRGLRSAARLGRHRDALVELTSHAAARLATALEPPAGGVARADLPGQVVDRWYLGWRLVSPEARMYAANPTGPTEPRSYRELAATRGPLRPVVAPGAADVHEIDQLLAEAGNRAAPTIAAAVRTAYARLHDANAHLGADASRGLARQRLAAASEGTPPAAALLALLGEREPTTAAGARPAARDALGEMILRWIDHPDHYTDPAVALVTVVPPRLMPDRLRRARRAWIRADPTLSLADAPDPEGRRQS